MSPLGVPFKDSHGTRGTHTNAPIAETNLCGKGERSMSKVPQSIHCQFKYGGFSLNLSETYGHRVRIKKIDMVRFANWILSTTRRTK